MTTFSQKNHAMILVGKDVAITGTTINTLADGEVRCFTPGGTLYTEAAADANDEFTIVMGRTGDQPLVSQKIKKDWVTSVSKKDYVADVEQVDFIGYTGVSGSIALSNNTVYRATINVIQSLETDYGQVYVKDLVYESDASATQAEIAIGLAGSGIGNFSREVKNTAGDPMIKFAAVCNVALAADFPFDATFDITATKGSDALLVAAATPTYNTGTGLAVGDYIRIGTAAGAIGTVALGSDVYKVVALPSTTTIKVDRPVQVAGGSYVVGGNITVVTAALGNAANWGVKLTGQDLDWKLGKLNDKIAKWKLNLDSDAFGATTLTNSTVATLGTGTYHQVAELEWFLNGNNGELYRAGEPNVNSYTQMALSTETYDIVTINLTKSGTSGLISTNNPQVVYIAIPAATPGGTEWYANGATDDTTDVLEDLLDGVKAYTTANSFDGTALTTADLTCG
jgi:hypothetical protein